MVEYSSGKGAQIHSGVLDIIYSLRTQAYVLRAYPWERLITERPAISTAQAVIPAAAHKWH
jgi:hypothetical protein